MGSRALAGGMVIGAAVLSTVVAYFLFAGPTAPAESADASSTTTTEAQAPSSDHPIYVDASEVIVGPAVLVPGEVLVSGRQVSLEYELHHVTPVEGLPNGQSFVPFQGFQDVPPEEAVLVFPEAWTLLVDDTEVAGTVANPNARAARFQVPEGVTASRIQAAWIDGYRLLIPVDIPFTLGASQSGIEIVPGVEASIIQVSDQGEETIVRVELSFSDPDLDGGVDVLAIGEGVVASVREAEGGPRWNLTYDGPPRDVYEMTLNGTMWLLVDGRIDVALEGRDG